MSSVRTALVISGGGSRGAFAVGAVKYLMENLGLSFDIYAGTSTGALITPLLAARGRGALPELERHYTSVRTTDILRGRQPPERALVSSSVFTTEPLALRIGADITPEPHSTAARGSSSSPPLTSDPVSWCTFRRGPPRRSVRGLCSRSATVIPCCARSSPPPASRC